MNCSLDSRRALCFTVVVIGSLSILSGCKHVYRGSGVEPPVSGPYLQPSDGEPLLGTPARHEPLPELSPVPPLPGAGHSVPPEPLPPPAPAEPTSTQAKPGQQPVSQTKSFWSQMSARASTGRSDPVSPLPTLREGRHAALASIGVSNRMMDPRLAATPLGFSTTTPRTNSLASKIGETTAGDIHSFSNLAGEHHNLPIASASSPALRTGLSVPVLRSEWAGVDAQGPVITPLQQPIATRSGVIENWPYRSQSPEFVADSRKNVSPPQASKVPTSPASEIQFGSTEPAPAAAQEEATVTSLLPPGP